VDGCESDDATTEIIVNANNQPYTEWNGNIDTDWFHPMNWTDCRPGPDSEAHIPRNVVTVRYPVVTNISPMDSSNPKGQARAKKVKLGILDKNHSVLSSPTLEIQTDTDLKINQ